MTAGDGDGDTLLMNAIHDGQIERARTLRDSGTNLALANNAGFKPLDIAVYYGDLEVGKNETPTR